MNARKSKSLQQLCSQLFVAGELILKYVIIFVIVFVCSQINLAEYFPIKTVKIYGVKHTDAHMLQTVLTPFARQGFFAFNVASVKDRLLQMPWVADLCVKRIWQDRVDIIITEKKAIAVWNNIGLLSDTGELFTPTKVSYPANLPILTGPIGQHLVVFDYFKKINQKLSVLHLKVKHLELSPYFTWQLMLDNGIILRVEHKDILTRLDHFVKVYFKIVGIRAAEIAYIDLRYPNGMAVGLKTL